MQRSIHLGRQIRKMVPVQATGLRLFPTTTASDNALLRTLMHFLTNTKDGLRSMDTALPAPNSVISAVCEERRALPPRRTAEHGARPRHVRPCVACSPRSTNSSRSRLGYSRGILSRSRPRRPSARNFKYTDLPAQVQVVGSTEMTSSLSHTPLCSDLASAAGRVQANAARCSLSISHPIPAPHNVAPAAVGDDGVPLPARFGPVHWMTSPPIDVG